MIQQRPSSTGLSPRLAGALTYAGWWVTGVLFWIVERRDPVVRFHAVQSVAAFGLFAALVSGLCLLAAASLSFMPRAFTALVWAAGVTWLLGVSVWLVAMWRAASGSALRIPLAAGLADRSAGRIRASGAASS